MSIARIAVVAFISLVSLMTHAQNNTQALPSIILSLLESDIDSAAPGGGLRAKQTTEVNDQTAETVFVTTFNYDNLGRAQSLVKQLFSGGEQDGQTNTSIEYDADGRTESSSSVTTDAAGEQTSVVNMTFTYAPSQDNLSQVTTITTTDSMSSSMLQEFDYNSLNRVSQVTSTITTPAQTSTVVATPSYSGERIAMIARTVTTPAGSTTDTLDLEYNETEHTSTTGTNSQSDLEAFLSGVTATEIIRNRPSALAFTITTEYENGDCDETNEANRRLINLFGSEFSTGGLGRRCR